MERLCIIMALLICGGCGIQSGDRVVADGNTRFNSYQSDTTDINSRIQQGVSFLTAGKTDSAIDLFNSLYTRSNVLQYKYGMSRSLEGLGRAYFRKGNMSESTRYLELSIKILEDLPGSRGLAGRLYANIANNFQTQGQYSMSILYGYKALEYLQDQPRELRYLAEAYSTMGQMWLRLEERNQAIHYLTQADSLGKALNDNYFLALNNIHLGSYYSESAHQDSSLFCYKRTLEYLNREGKNDVLLKAAALTNISRIYYQKDMPRDAGDVILQIDSLAAATQSPMIRAVADMAFAFSRYNLGDMKKAAGYYKKVVAYALPERQTGFLVPAYEGLVELYEASGNFREAIRYRKQLDTMRQINEKLEKNKTVDLLLKYHLAKKNEEISRQQLTLSIKDSQLKEAYIWLITVVVTLIFLILLGIHLYRIHKHRQRLQQSAIQHINDKQALSSLQALMEGEEQERNRIGRALHDGIMIQLSAVKMQISNMDPKEDLKQYKTLLDNVNSIIREVRLTAHNLMPDWLLEDGLGDALRYFCNSIEPNYGIRVSYHQSGNIPRFNADFEISIYRIVQELVQNIIKHAQSPKALVELSYIDDYLYLVVEDNGVGFDVDRLKKHEENGVGLVSIKRRVTAMNGKIDIQSNYNIGTSIYLEINTEQAALNVKIKDDAAL